MFLFVKQNKSDFLANKKSVWNCGKKE